LGSGLVPAATTVGFTRPGGLVRSFGLLGIKAGGTIGSLVTATAGAVLVLYLVSLIKKQ